MISLEQELLDNSKSLRDIIVPTDWLTPIEVAEIFHVKARTVNNWNDTKLSKVRKFKTPGNHNRYYRPDVLALLEQHENNAKP